MHNRYRDSLQGYQDFRTSMNGPSWNAGVGLKLRAIELSANYVWNRFDSANLTVGYPKKLLRLGLCGRPHRLRLRPPVTRPRD